MYRRGPELRAPSRRMAWALLAMVGLLILLGLTGAPCDIPPNPRTTNDAMVEQMVIDRMRNGEGYYSATQGSLRAMGYPLRPFTNFRLPALASIGAAVRYDWIMRSILFGLSCAVAALWIWEIGANAGTGVAVIGGLLLTFPVFLAGCASWAWLIQDTWIGLLIALSLWFYSRTRWAALLCAVLAVAIREHAILFVCVMGAAALCQRRWREMLAWATVFAGFVAYVVIHAHFVSHHVTPDDPAKGWIAVGGWPFVVSTARWTWVGLFAPTRVSAIVMPLVLCGCLWQPNVRLKSTVLTYAGLFLVVGNANNWYWGLIYCPLLAVGLAYAIPAVPTLLRAAMGVTGKSAPPTENSAGS